jgi:hypothetical protein
VLRSWDRFHLALPFGRGVFLWGEPIEIAADLDPAGLERSRLLVEDRMNAMAHEADRRVGHGTDTESCSAGPLSKPPPQAGKGRVGERYLGSVRQRTAR